MRPVDSAQAAKPERYQPIFRNSMEGLIVAFVGVALRLIKSPRNVMPRKSRKKLFICGGQKKSSAHRRSDAAGCCFQNPDHVPVAGADENIPKKRQRKGEA